MDFADQLRILEAAQAHPAKLALATVDLAYSALPDAERIGLREGLEAAAIPHWCDEPILAALLQISKEESAAQFTRLRALNVVEPFPARGGNAVNVHESTRLALRKRVETDEQARFRTLSERAATCFADNLTPAGRIERIYHVLCADPDRGTRELEKLDRDWTGRERLADRYALAEALREIEDARLLQGRARICVLLVIASIRADRALKIIRELAEQDPSNADWQRGLAMAHCRVGDVLEAQGKLEEAQTSFEEYLKIIGRLTEQDPRNADWQRGLAVAHSRMGSVLEAQGKLEEAQTSFGEDMRISHRLAEQAPSNADWQRELAVTHSRMGGVLDAQGKLGEAQTAFGESLKILHRLAEQDPTYADWQRGLAVGFGVSPLPTLEAELDRLKDRLLQTLLNETEDGKLRQLLRGAAIEASALAWTTAYPLLVLPVLLEEKAQAVRLYAERQARMNAHGQTASNLAFKAEY